jgi:cellulose synthase/poly-beta-1,6-N-acetylglucosamine synthase-like glycosyltransferase
MHPLIATVVFWTCLSGVFYHYVGYPILIWACSIAFGRSRSIPDLERDNPPSVSVVVAALNEESVIGDRITNALSADYPPTRFEFVVASDGSSDRTADIVNGYGDSRVRLFEFSTRRGKAHVLNDVIPRLSSDIVILSDANTFLEPAVVGRMVRWLNAPDVGVVVGRLVLTDPFTGNNMDGAYWKYETFLKQCESRLEALLGANGAIYGFRRSLFVPLPADTLVDDLVLPLLIKLRTRCAIIYDMDSVAHEEAPDRIGSEVERRRRIGAGGFGSLSVLSPLLRPSFGWTAFAFASHKLLRWVCPFLLLGLLVSNLLLLESGLYQVAFAAQVLFYAASMVGAALPGSSPPVRVLRLAALFSGMNLALLGGFWRWSSGQRGAVWQRTARRPHSAADAAPRGAPE